MSTDVPKKSAEKVLKFYLSKDYAKHCFNYEQTLLTILKVLDTTDGKLPTTCTYLVVGVNVYQKKD